MDIYVCAYSTPTPSASWPIIIIIIIIEHSRTYASPMS